MKDYLVRLAVYCRAKLYKFAAEMPKKLRHTEGGNFFILYKHIYPLSINSTIHSLLLKQEENIQMFLYFAEEIPLFYFF